MVRSFEKKLNTAPYVVFTVGVQYPSELEELTNTVRSVASGKGDDTIIKTLLERIRRQLESCLVALGGVHFAGKVGNKSVLEFVSHRVEKPKKEALSERRKAKTEKDRAPIHSEEEMSVFDLSAVLRLNYSRGPVTYKNENKMYLEKVMRTASVLVTHILLDTTEEELTGVKREEDGRPTEKRKRGLEIPLNVALSVVSVQYK
ncbi:hypothetical protein AGDE_13830 [Angomonas deanei]|nr:hypothetical protein AGDE_13830 [Angomonas deanei]|eukprot:EPY21721.1 hypothetical protein AGDE_13830 [Angomonas deanei]